VREGAGRSAASAGPHGTAKDRALRLLGVRWRSREELRRRLRQAGFEPEETEEALSDLERAGLVSDDRFAQEVVRDQAGRRMAGERVIRAALRGKGVAADVVERALVGLDDDTVRARALAARRAPRLIGLEPEAASRRLFGLLARRGFSPEVARDACREALREAFSALPGPDDGP
jgi:regulatory protein